MADQKLYHLINGEFVHDGMPSVQIPTYAEVSAHIAILRNVGFFDNPIAESVPAWDGLSNGKRTTEKQASLYDAMLAEIYAERNKAKARRVRKPDARTRAERLADWEQEKQSRKDRKWDRDWELYNRDWKARSDEMSHAERKIRYAEKIARKDYMIELRNIAEDDERMKIDAEIREWERKHAVEQANARAWMAMQNWLEWA